MDKSGKRSRVVKNGVLTLSYNPQLKPDHKISPYTGFFCFGHISYKENVQSALKRTNIED